MTINDDLATLRWPFANVDEHEAALDRVEASGHLGT